MPTDFILLLLTAWLVQLAFCQDESPLVERVLFVNTYPLQHDREMGQTLTEERARLLDDLQTAHLPVPHSAIEFSAVYSYRESFEMGWYFPGIWYRRSLNAEQKAMAMRSISFCVTTMPWEDIHAIFVEYQREFKYDLCTRNCNDAAFEVANLICRASDENFVDIKMPSRFSRLARLGSLLKPCCGGALDTVEN